MVNVSSEFLKETQIVTVFRSFTKVIPWKLESSEKPGYCSELVRRLPERPIARPQRFHSGVFHFYFPKWKKNTANRPVDRHLLVFIDSNESYLNSLTLKTKIKNIH